MFGFDSNLLGAVVLSIAGFTVARFLFRRDTAREDRRRAAGRVAGYLRSQGLQHLPEVLEDYSVGDYSGMAKSITKVAALLNDPEAAKSIFSQVVANVQEAQKHTTLDQAATPITEVKLKSDPSRGPDPSPVQ